MSLYLSAKMKILRKSLGVAWMSELMLSPLLYPDPDPYFPVCLKCCC